MRVGVVSLPDDDPALVQPRQRQVVGEIARRDCTLHLRQGGRRARTIYRDRPIVTRQILASGRSAGSRRSNQAARGITASVPSAATLRKSAVGWNARRTCRHRPHTYHRSRSAGLPLWRPDRRSLRVLPDEPSVWRNRLVRRNGGPAGVAPGANEQPHKAMSARHRPGSPTINTQVAAQPTNI